MGGIRKLTIYSKLLARGNVGGAGSNLVFTAASGFTTVLRDVEIYMLAATTSCDLVIAGVSTPLHFINGTAGILHAEWHGRMVMNAGDTCDVNFAGSGGQWYLSGYELV
jgi:hypothetical protein